MIKILAFDEFPSVISLILFNRKGVISAPETFNFLKNTINKQYFSNFYSFYSASLRASSIAILTFNPSASCSFGTGTVIKIPLFIANLLNVISINKAHSLASSNLWETLYPLSEIKNSGNLSVWYPITATPCVSRYSRVLGISRID